MIRYSSLYSPTPPATSPLAIIPSLLSTYTLCTEYRKHAQEILFGKKSNNLLLLPSPLLPSLSPLPFFPPPTPCPPLPPAAPRSPLTLPCLAPDSCSSSHLQGDLAIPIATCENFQSIILPVRREGGGGGGGGMSKEYQLKLPPGRRSHQSLDRDSRSSSLLLLLSSSPLPPLGLTDVSSRPFNRRA
eukprot:348891-Hanusia_phi.AAC.1